jgi:hypothetical protein
MEASDPYVVNNQNVSISLTKIATDSASNVYMLGTFHTSSIGSVNFDPTGGESWQSSNGQTWSFLTKITAAGDYGGTYFWADNVTIRDMTIDKSDNIYLLGQAADNTLGDITVNLEPAPLGNDVKTLNAGDTMGFYIRLKASGTIPETYTYDYSRTFKNTLSQRLEVDHLASTSAGNIFLYGTFEATTPMNFNSLGTDDKTSNNNSDDLYLSEYDASGVYMNTYVIGGSGAESAGALAVDNNDDIYYSGGFNSTVNFDPTGGTDSKTADVALPGQRFLSKLNSDISYNHTFIWNSNTLEINKINFDQNNLMYLIGISTGGTNYDPIGATDSQVGFGGNDAFTTIINPDGTYNYTYIWGGSGDEKAQDSAFDSLNNFYVAGSTTSLSVSFDPTTSNTFTTSPVTGGEWGYVTQFSATQVVETTPTPTPTTTPEPGNSDSSNNSSSGSSSNQSFTCTNHSPVAPKIFQIWATQTTATIYFVPSVDPQDSYTISYGVYSDAGMYNTSFNYSDKSGAIPYTINALSVNTPYYFKVRANNGCMGGEWSNTLNLKTAYSATGGNNAYASNAVLNNSTSSTSTGGSCSQYTVLPGDSLWRIAQKVLGAGNKYLQVWNANKGKFPTLNTSSTIRTGWTLSVGC